MIAVAAVGGVFAAWTVLLMWRQLRWRTRIALSLLLAVLGLVPLGVERGVEMQNRWERERAIASYQGWYAGGAPSAAIPPLTLVEHPDTWVFQYTDVGGPRVVLRIGTTWLTVNLPQDIPSGTAP